MHSRFKVQVNPVPSVNLGEVSVQLNRVCKSYGSTKALIEISASVRKGSIFGLLGPSGCGKTTALRCIVGRITIDTGEISVLGHRPGSSKSGIPGPKVGYMPQELALYHELTVMETLNYFANIHRMSHDDLNTRTDFLMGLLQLTADDKSKLIKNLSGGEQRRVSLAVALLHKPPLLILDEPTVGVDPILRRIIWRHLLRISANNNVTVIITTHYFEEARQAHKVGLMRNGKLLENAEPEYLLTHYWKPTLEDVFFLLCQRDERAQASEDTSFMSDAEQTALPLGELNQDNCNEASNVPPTQETASNVPPTQGTASNVSPTQGTASNVPPTQGTASNVPPTQGTASNVPPTQDTSIWDAFPSFYRIRALVVKQLVIMKRRMGYPVFTFIVPSIQIILFCLTFGDDPKDVPIAVFNNDTGYLGYHLGKELLSFVDKGSVTQVLVDDIADASNMVVNGDAWGTVYIASSFSEDLAYRTMSADNNISDEVFYGSSMHVRLDMTDQQIGYHLQQTFLIAVQDFGARIFTKLGMNPNMASVPLKFGEPIYGKASPHFKEFVSSGVIVNNSYFMAVGLTVLALIIEKKEGLLDRSFVAGVTSMEVMISHMITQFGVMIIQVVLALTFLLAVFRLPSNGPIILVILLAIGQGMAGMSFGFVVSAMCDTELAAAMISIGSFYPNLMLCGIIWPIEAMPDVLQYISILLPQTYASQAMRCILSRGRSITYMPVWRGFLVTLAWIGIFLFLAAVITRKRQQ